MKWVSDFKDRVKATLMCLMFPFLYPRNRWTGNHYDNWKILEFHRRNWKHTRDNFHIEFKTKTELGGTKLIPVGECVSEYKYMVRMDNKKLWIQNLSYKDRTWETNLETILEKGEILGAGFETGQKNTLTVIVSDDYSQAPHFCRFFEVIYDPWLLRVIKILDFWNDWVLAFFHCIPGYTELDALEPGWRKKFGLRLCFELWWDLLRNHGLFRFRIDQIKEKWGYLHFYAHNVPRSSRFREIIGKYEDISRRVCVCCGKPATKVSTGWISYYCDSCAPEGSIDKKEDQEC